MLAVNNAWCQMTLWSYSIVVRAIHQFRNICAYTHIRWADKKAQRQVQPLPGFLKWLTHFLHSWGIERSLIISFGCLLFLLFIYIYKYIYIYDFFSFRLLKYNMPHNAFFFLRSFIFWISKYNTMYSMPVSCVVNTNSFQYFFVFFFFFCQHSFHYH